MISITFKAAILVALISIANSQVCLSPTGFKSFNIATYSTGVWYGVHFMASMQTPLTSACSYGAASHNTSHITVSVTAKANGTTDTIAIVAKGNLNQEFIGANYYLMILQKWWRQVI